MPDPSSPSNLVLAITAENENETLTAASAFFGWELGVRGYRHSIIDMRKPESAQELAALLASKQVAFAYGFAGVGSRFTVSNGGNLWTAMKTPYIALWYDHPCYNYQQHIVDSPYVVQGYHLRDHIDARNRYLPPSSSRAVLLPGRFAFAPPVRHTPFKSRNRQILFAKTGVNPALLAEEWKEYPAALQKILWDLAEMAKKDRNIDLTAATARMFAESGQSSGQLDIFMGVVAAVDRYIRAWRSDRLARALLRHPSHIVGRGWDYLRDGSRRGEFHPPFSAHEFYERVQQYRISANTHPVWRDSVHERVYFTICVGGISLTDRTQKSDEIFAGLPNYIGFDWQDDLEDVIATALKRADDDEADFIEADKPVIDELLRNAPDYVAALEKAADSVHCG